MHEAYFYVNCVLRSRILSGSPVFSWLVFSFGFLAVGGLAAPEALCRRELCKGGSDMLAGRVWRYFLILSRGCKLLRD